MARVPLDIVVRGRQGDARRDVRLYVYDRDTTDEVDVYTLESGGSVIAQPLESDEEGRYPDAWLAPGSYDLHSPDDVLNGTQPWEAISGLDSAVVGRLSIPGAGILSTPDEIWAKSGLIKLVNIAGGGKKAPAIYLYSSHGYGQSHEPLPDDAQLAWSIGIDVAAGADDDDPARFRDLFIAKCNPDGSVQDFIYPYNMGADGNPRLGILWVDGNAPPPYTLSLTSPTAETDVGALGIRVPNTMDASVIAFVASATGDELFAIDKFGRIWMGPENGPVDLSFGRSDSGDLEVSGGGFGLGAVDVANPGTFSEKVVFNTNPTDSGSDIAIRSRYNGTEYELDVVRDDTDAILLSVNRVTGDVFAAGTVEADKFIGPPKAIGAFSAYRNAAQSPSNGTVIGYDTEIFDVSNWFDTATNVGRFTPQVAGFYRLSAAVAKDAVNTTTGKYWAVSLRKNGSLLHAGCSFNETVITPTAIGSWVVQANGSTDYFDIVLTTNEGASAIVPLASHSYFQGELVGTT